MEVRKALRGLVVGCATVTLLVTAPGTAEAKWGPGASGSDRWVNIETFDDGRRIGRVDVTLTNKGGGAYFHARLFNGSYGENTQARFVPIRNHCRGDCVARFSIYPNRTFADGSKLCAEVWRHDGRGRYSLMGRPCLWVEK